MSDGLQKQPHNELMMIEGCRKGDPAAQRLLYDTYVNAILVLCLRYINDRHDAREVMMDAFLNCYKSIVSFRVQGEGSLKAWLKRIAINQCLMYLRKRKTSWQDLDNQHDLSDAGQESGLDRLSAKELLGYIQELPDGYRTVFNLYAFESFSHREIADTLQITESTSKSQLHKARALLQKRIIQAKNRV